MPRSKKPATPTSLDVDAIHHPNEMRVNIPTNELRDFIGDEELMPPTLRYPRDPSLDPQLVWNGKDEQDGEDLAVRAVPIYIQEKIEPRAIIEEVRRQAASSKPQTEQQMSLFSDFNGIDFEQLIEFYQHEQHWTNRMILGDSLHVMTSLAEKEGLKGKVQMIYIDPPYGIKFGSNWQVSTRKRDVRDGREEDLVRQPEQIRAFRDTWEKGIHSYLSYLRDRLMLARELLTESGSVFVQINAENSHLIRSLMDEVFGAENFVADIVFRKKSIPLGATYLETMHDYIMFYAKDKPSLKFKHLYEQNDGSQVASHGPYAMYPDGKAEKIDLDDFQNSAHPTGTSYYRLFSLLAPSYSAQTDFTYHYQGRSILSPNRGSWVIGKDKLDRLVKVGRLQQEGGSLSYRLFFHDFPYKKVTSSWNTAQVSYKKSYVVQTAPSIIERCILMTTDPGDLVLDPTMGSGTTAYVAEQWGRRWITCDTSRVSLALARTRLMAARYPFYLLADSEAGANKEMELSSKLVAPRAYSNDIRHGFVYERVPHITLRDIANNAEIDTIHANMQPYLEERRVWLNAQLGTTWEEWEVPRTLPDSPGLKTGAENNEDVIDPQLVSARSLQRRVLDEYWQGRRDRQREIDASISRSSERETLYDRPYEDKKRVRVTGPFTVESLSPHRILDPGYAEKAARHALPNLGSYEQMVIDNLRVAGVQNTRKDERLVFQTLEIYAGVWLHADGTYLDANGDEKRVAVSIGSEHGTVTARQIKEAAKEAVRGIGYDLLLVCGFAFDAAASEETKRYGKLDVQIVRMNSDLMMGSALKQTDRANLFTIFGEPDIDVTTQADGQIVVKLRGLDIYDPTTGAIRSSSTDDIACWFIDTTYNDESFFVRHAYFLGREDAYDNLKRALRAEVDESAWDALYRDKSMPFARPEGGRIAVKVINHYGDEVLKVYGV